MTGKTAGAAGQADAGPIPGGTAGDEGWALRPLDPADVEPLAELRAQVMRADLERLGRWDEHRVRQRWRDSYDLEHTFAVTVDGDLAGCVTFRPAQGGLHIEHFYLAPHLQGRGLGSAVLGELLARADAQGLTVRLVVLQGSPARRLYERHGFTLESEDPVDVLMSRPSTVHTS